LLVPLATSALTVTGVVAVITGLVVLLTAATIVWPAAARITTD